MASIQTQTDYMIVNYNSGLVWAVQNSNPAVGTSIIQFSWQINPTQYNQRWNFAQVSGGWQICTPDAFGSLYAGIDKARAPSDNGAGVNVYPIASLTTGLWTLGSANVGEWMTITNVKTGLCCNVSGESTSNDAYIVQWEKISQAGQQWMIVPYITGMTP